MTENIEFIPAHELPATEGNEVSVLCVENGELKQKPANGLGGEKADLVLLVNANPFDPELTADAVSIESGSVVDIMAIIEAGEIPVVKAKYSWDYVSAGFRDRHRCTFDCQVEDYNGLIHLRHETAYPGGTYRYVLIPEEPDALQCYFYPHTNRTSWQVI